MDRYAVVIVTPRGYAHSAAFREVGETLLHGLRRLGHDAVLTDGTTPKGRRAIVLGSNLAAQSGQPLPKDAILYNLEQVEAGSPWMTPRLLELFRRHELWDYSERNAARLAELGIPRPRVVPIGFVPELARIPGSTEDIDVLFYGSLNDRRARVLDELRRRGLRVEALFGVYGEERDRAISRSKVVLNVHYYEAKVFEIVRVSYLLANRRCVVSERGADPAEERPFEDGIAFADHGALADACARLVADPVARAELAGRGFALMSARDEAGYLAEALGVPAPAKGDPAVAGPPPLDPADVVAIARPPGLRVLLAGPADGALGAALLSAGAAEVVAVDPDAGRLAGDRVSAAYRQPVDREALPYPDGYFDLVVVEDLSALRRPADALVRLRRLLADRGRLACVVPSAAHEAALATFLRDGALPPGAGVRPMDVPAGLDAIRAAGFDLEDEAIAVRTEPGPHRAALAAACASLGASAEAVEDRLGLVRAVVGARPSAPLGARAEAIPDPWRGSRPERWLVAPDLADPRDEWLPALARLVARLGQDPGATVGLALPLPFLSEPPEHVKRIAELARVDFLLVEAPVDPPGWERLMAGASVWIRTSDHAVAAVAARFTGVEVQAPPPFPSPGPGASP